MPQAVCSVGATLGEGPVWVVRDQALWFVDIKGLAVFRFTPETGVLSRWPVPAQPGWILPDDDGGFIVGLQSGLHRFDPGDGSCMLFAAIASEPPTNRLNDATVDPHGRLWFGSMDDAEASPTGRIYRFESGVAYAAALAPVAITNGPAFSPDGQILYHVDTLAGIVYASRIGDDGEPCGTSVFARIDPADGYPDGPTVDAAGCLWIGLYGGWAARCYAPDGNLRRTIRFPTANITKLAFGGDDLCTVYATTARKGLDAAAVGAQPQAGDIFAFRVPVPGIAGTPVRRR